MRNTILISILLLLLTACKKQLIVENITDSKYIKTNDLQVINGDDLILSGEVVSGNVTQYGFVVDGTGRSPFLSPFNGISVNTAYAPNYFRGTFPGYFDALYPDATYAIRAFGIIDGQTYYGKTVKHTSPSRGSWKRLNNFPGPLRIYPVSFAVNGKGYVGCGAGAGGNLNDMWEYDPATDTWTRITDYPGPPMNSGFSFVIGNKAYVGGGAIAGSPPYSNYLASSSFYEFDPVTKNWTRKTDIPYTFPYDDPGIYGAFSFSVGGFGFVGGGASDLQQKNGDIFKYDPAANYWEEYSLLPKNYRNEIIYFHYGAAFVLDNLAYVGTGFSEFSSTTKTNTFYSWNYQTKEWKYIIEMPGPKVAFGIGTGNSGVGYMGLGDPSNDLYQFKPVPTGSVWKMASHNADHYGTKGGACFTIGNKTYIGLGDPVIPSLYEGNRLYEFTHTR